MLTINKISLASPIDYAAEELKKYLRMMMPEVGDISISYNPEAEGGFRLGLMQDFGLDVSDAENTELDDILYIDCDECGGIIAGDNPRSVLLSVYEYLRQNGCRWLYPGVDGEYIPMKDIVPVKYRHKPSCRYRGQCNEGAESQQCMLETIEFTPKVGMNVYMLEFRIPRDYYEKYYNHSKNEEARPPEPITDEQVLQWKRQCEAEIAKRGLQFHDIGHGFTVDPFGIDSANCWTAIDDSEVPENMREFLAEMGGKRGLYHGQPVNTNFCMSNPVARKMFAEYVANYAEGHSNADYLHVWLADMQNNHCECAECQKKTASDWYIKLMNEVDAELTQKGLKTRIVFIAYLDTTWAPELEVIKNPDRFTLLLAPITRSYEMTLPEWGVKAVPTKYRRNENIMPRDLEEYFAHFLEWKKTWGGANLSYEYHFWIHQYHDLSGLEISRRISEDVKVYKQYGINGIIEDGSQRSFFPSGLAFYTYARTLYDTSLSFEEILEDYLSHIYGEDWRDFYSYLTRVSEAIPYSALSARSNTSEAKSYLSDSVAESLSKIPEIVAEGRKLIKSHYNSKYRVQTVSVRLLELHALYLELMCDALRERFLGNYEAAAEKLERARLEMGKQELEFDRYYDHMLLFGSFNRVFDERKTGEPMLVVQ